MVSIKNSNEKKNYVYKLYLFDSDNRGATLPALHNASDAPKRVPASHHRHQARYLEAVWTRIHR